MLALTNSNAELSLRETNGCATVWVTAPVSDGDDRSDALAGIEEPILSV